MARPERNITGVSLGMPGSRCKGSTSKFSGKLCLRHRALPISRTAQNGKGLGDRLPEKLASGRELQSSACRWNVRQENWNIGKPSRQWRSNRSEALMANGLPSNFEHRELILELAVKYRSPSINGGLTLPKVDRYFWSMRQTILYHFLRWADEIGQTLNGVAPADIPIQQPTKLILAINLKPLRPSVWMCLRHWCSGLTK